MMGNLCSYTIGIFLLSMFLSFPSFAAVYTISPDGLGDYPTIQEAVTGCDPGDIIELTDGVFNGDGNRDIEYHGKSIIVRSQSGDPESCIIDCEGSAVEYHRGFYFLYQEDADARVENLKIINGYVSGDD
ncbi:MAG: hypothetical protein KJ970_09725 [Candidatus Eisenbacteria bacterium]|uniref:Uncharacterized protein n=1 Tax=Eiseniibacteriota bacterium TaxID=2212470 RepID=A0A948W716_UNCEI|nr:hypothetical protein [Candidatus Eisenbacteria bacterium]MBU1949397.1 hypothetical protein [Candidatus Eisenbacteria bacterium]MBU2691196.1 hypothetical protein [Candidatus Eisenbacteria bacterium]